MLNLRLSWVYCKIETTWFRDVYRVQGVYAPSILFFSCPRRCWYGKVIDDDWT